MLNLSAKRVCSRKEGGERGLVTRHLLPASQVWKIAQGIARRFGGGERERERETVYGIRGGEDKSSCLWAAFIANHF